MTLIQNDNESKKALILLWSTFNYVLSDDENEVEYDPSMEGSDDEF